MPVYSNLVTMTHLRDVELTFPSLRGGTVRNILDEFEKKNNRGLPFTRHLQKNKD